MGNLKYFCLKTTDDLYFFELNCKYFECDYKNLGSEYISCKLSLHTDQTFSGKKNEYLSLMRYFYKLKSII